MIIETMGRRRTPSYTKALFHFDSNLGDEVAGNNWFVNAGYDRPYLYISANSKFGAGFAWCSSSDRRNTFLEYSGLITNILDITKDFTFDVWVKNSSNYLWLVAAYSTATISQSPTIGFFITDNTIGIRYYIGGTLSTVTANYTDTYTWMHFAYVRSGTTNYIFINGILSFQNTTNVFDASNYLRVGQCFDGGATTNQGYIDELRISSVARWTSDFTPPTSAYTLD